MVLRQKASLRKLEITFWSASCPFICSVMFVTGCGSVPYKAPKGPTATLEMRSAKASISYYIYADEKCNKTDHGTLLNTSLSWKEDGEPEYTKIPAGAPVVITGSLVDSKRSSATTRGLFFCRASYIFTPKENKSYVVILQTQFYRGLCRLYLAEKIATDEGEETFLVEDARGVDPPCYPLGR